MRTSSRQLIALSPFAGSSALVRALILACVAVVALAGPAHAQYGGPGITFFPDPRVPIGQTYSVFGTGCSAGETVVITIEGLPGTTATTTATAGGNFAVSGIDLPPGATPGTVLNHRATCGPQTTTGLTTVLCSNGTLPVDGVCEDGSGGTSGGVPTTTTLVPNPGDGGSTSGGVPSDGSSGGSNPGLAITGASFTALLVQGAVTLFAGGFLLLMVARRRQLEAA